MSVAAYIMVTHTHINAYTHTVACQWRRILFLHTHTHTHTHTNTHTHTHTQGSKMSSQWRRALWRRDVGFAPEMLSHGMFCLVFRFRV
jgi:hypothetical protein